jgi:hypothetical protein
LFAPYAVASSIALLVMASTCEGHRTNTTPTAPHANATAVPAALATFVVAVFIAVFFLNLEVVSHVLSYNVNPLARFF